MMWNEVKIVDGKKPCGCCKKLLPVSSFAKSATLKCGYRSDCKECRAAKKRVGWVKRDRRRKIVDGKQECATCKRNLPVNGFYKSKATYSGLEHRCKECGLARKRKTYNENPESRVKIKRRSVIYHHKNKDKQNHARRRNALIGNYGITIADYDRMFEEQEGNCKTCGLPEINQRLSIDHCHETGKVRGLLCSRCNMILGHVEENTETLWKMIEYLREYEVAKLKGN